MPPSIEEDLLAILRDHSAGKRIGQAISSIAQGLPKPVVFHCRSGKDRTGIIAMVLLGSLGVPDTQIMDDFTLAELDMDRVLQRQSEDSDRARALDRLPEWAFQAPPGGMKTVLETVKMEFGSIREYAAAQGVSKSVFEKLETSLLM